MNNPIARNRASTLCLKDQLLLMIELKDPTTQKCFWSVPGGMVEPGETPEDCAIRETLEETGYSVRLLSCDYPSTYPFRWNLETYLCQGHWFLAEPSDDLPLPVFDAPYLLQNQWIPLSRVSALLSYHPELQQHILKLIQCADHNPV